MPIQQQSPLNAPSQKDGSGDTAGKARTEWYKSTTGRCLGCGPNEKKVDVNIV